MPPKPFRWTPAENRADLAKFLEDMRRIGAQHFQFLGARDGLDCPACLAMDGPIFKVNNPPEFPPAACRCEPHGCRLCAVIAS